MPPAGASPVPAPIARPAVPTYYAASSPSGAIPASGQSGALSGPWATEEQGMTIFYNRAPEAEMISYGASLSSFQTVHQIIATHMAVQVHAYYRVRKDWNLYHTSGWTQPQKFEVQSFSADPSGNTYGTVSAGTFGPAGIVFTAQPWYWRRYWNSADVEIDQAAIGFNFYATDSGAANDFELNGAANGGSQIAMMQSFGKYNHSHNPGTWMEGCHLNWFSDGVIVHGGDTYLNWKSPLNTKLGGYRADQDVPTDVPTMVNNVGYYISTGLHLLKEGAIGMTGGTGPAMNDNLVQVEGYENSRHDWT